MGDAVLLGALVPAAGADPEADRGRLQARHGLGDDAQAVGQGVQLDTHAKTPSSISASMARRGRCRRAVTRSGRSSGRPCAAAGRADAAGGLHRVGEFRRMRGGQRDSGVVPVKPCATWTPTAECGQSSSPIRSRARAIMAEVSASDAGPRRTRSRKRLQRALGDVEAAGLQLLHQLRHGAAVAAIGVEQRALEIRRHLDVHRRADRRRHAIGHVIRPSDSARCRMSFWLVATTRRSIGRPMRRAM
jgi:hypothetical protein